MHITLHLTTGCNMNCSYCYAHPDDRLDMTEEIVEQAINFGFQSSPNNLGIIFFGGEPLLKKDLIKSSISYSDLLFRGTGFVPHYKITTNGLLLDEEFLKFANSVNMSVALSLDGIQEAHDYHRKTKDGQGTFKILEQKLDLLLSYQPYTSIYITITPETVKYYHDSVRYLFGRGIRYLIASINYAGDWKDSDLIELQRQYKLISKLYKTLIHEQKKFYFSPFEIKFASRIKGDSFKCGKCHLGMRQVSVSPDGSIYPCVQFVNRLEYKIGDVTTGIDYKTRNNLYELSTSNISCNDCALKNRCNNSCSCLNIQTTGMINEISPTLCNTEKILFPIVDKLGEKLYRQKAPMFIQKHYNAVYPLLSCIDDLHP